LQTIKVGNWEIWIEDGSLPRLYERFIEEAEFVDEVDIENPEGRLHFLGVHSAGSSSGWPSIIVAQKYQDAQQAFRPGVLVVPETSLVFIGAGERILCYDIQKRERIWQDHTQLGFWGWSQLGEYVLMSAELEFGVWTQNGEKLWTTFVEPPWDFKVLGQTVELNIMGAPRHLNLADGKPVD